MIGSRPAQTQPVEPAHLRTKCRRGLSAGCQRMFEQCQEGHRRKSGVGRFGQQAQERAGCGMCQGPPGGVVDGDIPPAQLGGDAAGEIAIRCHQRRRLVLLFELFAQHQRDGGSFIAGMRGLD